jgi:glutamyl-tRNA synthetase
VVVDDVDMGMTHVIRGDDHVNNTPRQILLYKAMDADLPFFAHVPMILGPDKKKLSKRHGATNVVQYREMGYLPEAMLNALARLGWSHGDQEIFSREELISSLTWMPAARAPRCSIWTSSPGSTSAISRRPIWSAWPIADQPFHNCAGVESIDDVVLKSALPHLTPRAKDLTELADWAEPYLVDEPVMDPKAVKKFLKPANVEALERVWPWPWNWGWMTPEPLEDGLKALAEKWRSSWAAWPSPPGWPDRPHLQPGHLRGDGDFGP